VSGVQLFVEPQAKEAPVLTAIRGATHSIWIEMYLFTNLDVIYALEDAAHRGVETRVLLEMNPYGGGDVSPRLLSEKLTAAGVAVRPANPAFTFTHAKFMLVDGATAYIMTCNLTQSALGGSASATNREYLIADTHAEDTAAVAAIFQADWDRTQPVVNDANLVVSPTNSRAKLTGLIDSARTTLLIEQEEMDDPGIEDRLIAAAQRGVKINITLAVFSDSASSPSEDVQRLRSGSVEVRYSHTLYVHAKLILVDGKRAFVGSQNFSAVSLDANREVGIIVSDAAVVAQLASVAQGDWNVAQAA
jgi:phosphatidylserine/phosphatidylglycerophosphate/cardiolipin synthase-like enzyme